jgi:indole-3-glycerol phosphate synthase
MNILDKIIASKHNEIKEKKSLYPVRLLERSALFYSPTLSLRYFLSRSDKNGIIAEFKRMSPSRGMINKYASVEEVTRGYMQGGASALSVLTDTAYFGGSYEDLKVARHHNYAPILNKNFIIDEYQIVEAKANGADVILLIAACLSKEEVLSLSAFAKRLDLEVLLEIHHENELSKLCEDVDLVGVNNRNLKNFDTNIEHSIRLAEKIPDSFTKVAESGISSAKEIIQLREEGYSGFLMGTVFMTHPQPHKALLNISNDLQKKERVNSLNSLT